MNKRTQRKVTGKGFVVGSFLIALSACLPHEVGDGEGGSHLKIDRSEADLSPQELNEVALQISEFLKSGFARAEAKLDAKYAVCSNPEQLSQHAYALLAFGREQDCLQAVNRCMGEVTGPQKGTVAFAGGQCAWKAGAYAQAYDFFREATKRDLYGGDPAYPARVFEYARFVEIVSFLGEGTFSPERTAKEIFALAFSTGDRDAFNQLYSLVRASITANSNVFQKTAAYPDFKALMNERIGTAAPEFSDYLRLVYYRVFSGGDYRSRDALVALRGWISQKALTTLPYHKLHSLFSISYSNLYIQPGRTVIRDAQNARRQVVENIGLYTASRLYETYKPFANSKYSLPESQSFLTYEQLYSSRVCQDSLLDETGKAALSQITSAWETGSLSVAEALSKAQELDKEPVKADLKTFIGNLYQLEGNLIEAEKHYDLAHTACPYYNRSHAGLRRILASKANRARSQSETLRTDFLAKAPAEPEKIEAYVTNYKQMNEEQRKILLASLDMFVPYVNFLADNGYSLYMKHVYQRLSDLPGLQGLKGERVPQYDQRLRDDIRGIATEKVIVADLLEMQEIPYGDSNVPVHEAAHQFHRAASESVKTCVTELFNAAKGRNGGNGLFSLGYAATNEYEYFAMGVEHYVIPEDSPSFMGINRGWYMNNDPRLFLLVQKIKEAAGDETKIANLVCPAATDPVPLPEPKRDITASVLKGSDGKGYFLGAAMDPEVESAYVCFAPEVDCRSGQAKVHEMGKPEFVGATSFFLYPRDLKLSVDQPKHITILGKESGSSRFSHSLPITAVAQ